MNRLSLSECYKLINPTKRRFFSASAKCMLAYVILAAVLRLLGLIGAMIIWVYVAGILFATVEIICTCRATGGLTSSKSSRSTLLLSSPYARTIATRAFICDEIRRFGVYAGAMLLLLPFVLIPDSNPEFATSGSLLTLMVLDSVFVTYFITSAFGYFARRYELTLIIVYLLITLAMTSYTILSLPFICTYSTQDDSSVIVLTVCCAFSALLAAAAGILSCRGSIKSVIANYNKE